MEIAPRRWRAEVELARMPHAEAAEIQALIDALGPSGSFYLHNPAQLGPRGRSDRGQPLEKFGDDPDRPWQGRHDRPGHPLCGGGRRASTPENPPRGAGVPVRARWRPALRPAARQRGGRCRSAALEQSRDLERGFRRLRPTRTRSSESTTSCSGCATRRPADPDPALGFPFIRAEIGITATTAYEIAVVYVPARHLPRCRRRTKPCGSVRWRRSKPTTPAAIDAIVAGRAATLAAVPTPDLGDRMLDLGAAG